MALTPFPIQSRLMVAGPFAVWTAPLANWFARAWEILAAVEQSGTTANRPTANRWTGRTYFDTTLGRPIWWNGTDWIRADGVVV
jgi:hypothetical protein